MFDIVAKTMNALTTIETQSHEEAGGLIPIYMSFGAFKSVFADMCMYDPYTEVMLL